MANELRVRGLSKFFSDDITIEMARFVGISMADYIVTHSTTEIDNVTNYAIDRGDDMASFAFALLIPHVPSTPPGDHITEVLINGSMNPDISIPKSMFSFFNLTAGTTQLHLRSVSAITYNVEYLVIGPRS